MALSLSILRGSTLGRFIPTGAALNWSPTVRDFSKYYADYERVVTFRIIRAGVVENFGV